MKTRFQGECKKLRYQLYARQRRLLKLPEGHESVCLPGGLVKLNPNFFLA